MKIGYLLKDKQEKFNNKRAWYVNAWRVVDEKRQDLFQPWPQTKKEAREIAKKLNIKIRGEIY